VQVDFKQLVTVPTTLALPVKGEGVKDVEIKFKMRLLTSDEYESFHTATSSSSDDIAVGKILNKFILDHIVSQEGINNDKDEPYSIEELIKYDFIRQKMLTVLGTTSLSLEAAKGN